MCMPSRTLRLATVLLVSGALASVALSAQSSWEFEPLDASGTVTYFIADGEPESVYRPADRDLATWVLRAWEHSVGGALRFKSSSEDEVLIHVYWVTPDAGLYGEMQPVTVNGLSSADVYVRPDTSVGGEEISRRARTDSLFRDTVVYLTCLHELGHALGLAHTDDFADIMYFFGVGGNIPGFFNRYWIRLDNRDSIAGISGLSPGDIGRVRALYPSP